MNDYDYSMLAEWRLEPMSTTQLGERFLQTLERLREAAPELGELKVADLENPMSRRLLSIDEARARIPELVEAGVIVFDGDPQPDEGYHMLGLNTVIISPKLIKWSAKVGGRYGTRLTFEVGGIMVPSDPAIVTYSMFRAVLLTTIAQWPSNWANASAYKRGYYDAPTAPGVPAHSYSRFHLCWLSYLSAPLAAGLKPPPEILSERTPDGGLLMIAAEERLDPANPDHMRRSRMIAEIMIRATGEAAPKWPQPNVSLWPKKQNS